LGWLTSAAELRAYERTNPIVVRVPGTLGPTAAGASATARIKIPDGVKGWELWLGGSFVRGFDVAVDGHPIGAVADQLEPLGAYEQVGPSLTLTPGVHSVTVTFPSANLSPGNADLDSSRLDQLTAIALSPPLYPASGSGTMLTVAASDAQALCGRSLDWIEIVKPV
jgi:hypothetical protein